MCFWTGHVALLTLQSLLKRILSLSNWHGCWDQDMEDLQRKVASRRGHSAFDQTPKQNGRYNGRWDRCGTKSNNWYYIGQLEQNCQKLSQLDSKIADLIVKLEDLELEILQSEELQCAIKGQICRVKTFLEISNTATRRAYRTKHTTPQWNHHSTVTTICRIRKQLSMTRSSAGHKHGECYIN